MKRSILSFTFTAPPKMTQADFEVWTSRIKTQMYASHKTPALLLCNCVASAGSCLGIEKSSAAQFQFTCVSSGKKSKLRLAKKRIWMFSIPRKEHRERSPEKSTFLQMGLNFKASGQRQLDEAGFETAQGAPLHDTKPRPRSQLGTMSCPQGKRQPEPRGGFRINSKNLSQSHPTLWEGAKALRATQRDAAARQGAGREQAGLPAVSAASAQTNQSIPCLLELLSSSSPSSRLQEPGWLSEQEQDMAIGRKKKIK